MLDNKIHLRFSDETRSILERIQLKTGFALSTIARYYLLKGLEYELGIKGNETSVPLPAMSSKNLKISVRK